MVVLAQVMQSWPTDLGMWGFSWRAQQVLVVASVVLSALLVIWKLLYNSDLEINILWAEQRRVQSRGSG